MEMTTGLSKIFHIMIGRNKWLIVLLAISQLLVGVIPALLLYVTGKAVETIVHSHYYGLILALGAVILLAEFSEMLMAITSSILSDAAQKNLKQILIDKTASPPNIDHFSNHGYQDVFFLTEKNINEMAHFIIQCSFFISGMIGLLSIGALLMSLDWWIPLLLILGVMPVIYYRFKLEKMIWRIETINAKKFKLLTLIYEGLTRGESAKELRLNKYIPLLRAQWDRTYSFILRTLYMKRFRGLLKLFIISFPGVILIIVTLCYVGSPLNDRNYDVSQLIILFGAILQIRTQVMIVVANFASLSSLFFSANSILKLMQCNIQANERRVFDTSQSAALSVEHVSFKYPGADGFVLEDISFSISHNTLNVIVAPNGAGKSTLTNIITGMYREFIGHIVIGVTSAAHIWGVNQNFKSPSLTLHEFLDPYKKCDVDDIKASLRCYELSHLVDKLNCYLDARFEDFIELSGGQWQRLALVNVDLHYQEYQLIILDELNSALDSAGDKLYLNLLLKIKKQTTVIIISHKSEIHAHCDHVIQLPS